jgi:hypothetical protein
LPILAFALGVALTAGAAVLLARPEWVWEPYLVWRHGAVPSRGVVMTLRQAPSEVSGPGPGPWLELEFHNVSGEAQELVFQDPPGEELAFEGVDADGRALPPRRDPSQPSVARPLRASSLPPGERLARVVDLSEWIRLEGPGPYTVTATRYPLLGGQRDGHRCRSNAIAVPSVSAR